MSSIPTDNRMQLEQPDALTAGWRSLPPEYAIPEHAPSLEEARNTARGWLTRTTRTSRSLPGFCRNACTSTSITFTHTAASPTISATKSATPASLALLDAWEAELNATYLSLVEPPDVRTEEQILESVACRRIRTAPPSGFRRLAETIRQVRHPAHPFADLLTAFRQDQTVTRYETFDDLLGYCKNSANPVGHSCFILCGYKDAERQQTFRLHLHRVTTGKFLAGCRGRLREGKHLSAAREPAPFGVSESDIAQATCTPQFLEMMKFEVARARDWFERGLPLAHKVDKATRSRYRTVLSRRA